MRYPIPRVGRAVAARPRPHQRCLFVLLSGLLSIGVIVAGAGQGGAAPAKAEVPASIGPGATAVHPNAAELATGADLCAQVGAAAGFPKDNRLVTAVAVGLAESSCNPSAQSGNGPTSGCPNGSTDRGLWQINNCYHPEVSDACAYDAQCNADAAYRISSGGTNWSPWSTYNSGAYQSYLGEAQAAVDRLGGSPPPTGSWPTVQQGQSGVQVQSVQYLLDAHGAGIAVDGQFGPATNAAVRSFQSAHGLSVDGIVGPQTWGALIVTVQQGSTGLAVDAVQNELDAHGAGIAVDGQFGPATNAAVRSFQSAHGLSVDGIVGPQTWQALVS